MDKNSRRVPQSELNKDTYVLDALQGIGGYRPANPEWEVENLIHLQQSLQEARKTEVQKEGEWKASRDNAVKSEHAFHAAMLGAKDQIRAQFGADSDEYQSIGMKKKSEYKTPTKKKEA